MKNFIKFPFFERDYFPKNKTGCSMCVCALRRTGGRSTRTRSLFTQTELQTFKVPISLKSLGLASFWWIILVVQWPQLCVRNEQIQKYFKYMSFDFRWVASLHRPILFYWNTTAILHQCNATKNDIIQRKSNHSREKKREPRNPVPPFLWETQNPEKYSEC